MKRVLISVFLALAAVNAVTAQITGIRISNASVPETLHEIGRLTGYEFFYNSGELSECTKTVNIDSDDASIEDVLSNVLADTGFTFRIKDRTIIIIPSDRTRNQRSVISGRVFSAADGLPVPGVSVYVEGTMSGTFTDADGNEDGNGEN